MAASSLVARRSVARYREISVHITSVECILTAPAGVGLAVVKVTTSEPGLYGLGCATFTQRLLAVRTVVDDYLAPLLAGRDTQRIEDIWQLVYQNAYWRNGSVLNNALSGVDEALWDIKGKAAGMPLYQLLGGKMRDSAATYAHADGRDPQEVLDRVQELQASGLRHVRCQMGGYGGVGGTQESHTFDPARYARSVPELFESLRGSLGFELELLHDVHERLARIEAVRLAKELEPYRLFYLEDPSRRRTSPGFASCVRRPRRPSRWVSCSHIRSSGGSPSRHASSTSSGSTSAISAASRRHASCRRWRSRSVSGLRSTGPLTSRRSAMRPTSIST